MILCMLTPTRGHLRISFDLIESLFLVFLRAASLCLPIFLTVKESPRSRLQSCQHSGAHPFNSKIRMWEKKLEEHSLLPSALLGIEDDVVLLIFHSRRELLPPFHGIASSRLCSQRRNKLCSLWSIPSQGHWNRQLSPSCPTLPFQQSIHAQGMQHQSWVMLPEQS